MDFDPHRRYPPGVNVFPRPLSRAWVLTVVLGCFLAAPGRAQEPSDATLEMRLERELRDLLAASAPAGGEAIARSVAALPSLRPFLTRALADPATAVAAVALVATLPGVEAADFVRMIAAGLAETPAAEGAAGAVLLRLHGEERFASELDRLLDEGPAVQRATLAALAQSRQLDVQRRSAVAMPHLAHADAAVRAAAARVLLAPPQRLATGRALLDRSDVVGLLASEPADAAADLAAAMLAARPRAAAAVLAAAARGGVLEHRLVIDAFAHTKPEDAGAWIELLDLVGVSPSTRSSSVDAEATEARHRLLEERFGPIVGGDESARTLALLTRPELAEVVARALQAPPHPGAAEMLARLAPSWQQRPAAEVVAALDAGESGRGVPARVRLALLAQLTRRAENDVAAAAQRALAGSGSPLALAFLLAARPRDEEAALAIAVAALRHGAPAAESRLRAALAARPASAHAAIDALADAAGDPVDRLAHVIMDAGDEAAMERWIEVFAAPGRTVSDEVARRLLTTDVMTDFRMGAIHDALAADDPMAHAVRVVDLLESEVLAHPAVALAWLAGQGDAIPAPLFGRHLDDDGSRVRTAALRGYVARVEPGERLRAAVHAARDDEAAMRALAASSLAGLDDPLARGTLVVLAKDDVAYVRESALLALAATDVGPSGPVLPTLRAALHDAAPDVVNAARIALLAQGVDDVMEDLEGDARSGWHAARSRRALERFARGRDR